MHDLRPRTGQVQYRPRDFEDRELPRVPEIYWAGNIARAVHHLHQTGDQVVDIAEGARVRAVAENGYVLIEQRLDDEIRHNAAVVGMCPRAIGIEDAQQLDREAVLPPIIEE